MIEARIVKAVGDLPAAEWNALNGGNPFLSHEFLTAMEDSGSVGTTGEFGDTGWSPAPIVITGADGRLAAALPAYLKAHSQGE